MINFSFFLFFLFSISHSNVIHRETCAKDFSGTTAPRILKFGTNVGYDLLYYVKENQHAAAYHFLNSPFFFLSKQIFCYKFLSFYESQGLQILFTHWEWPSIFWDRKQNWDLFFLRSSLFHLSLQCNTWGNCDKYFSGTIARRILWFGTSVVNHLLFYVRENQILPSYSSLNFLHCLSFQFSNIKTIDLCFLRDWGAHKDETWSTHGP